MNVYRKYLTIINFTIQKITKLNSSTYKLQVNILVVHLKKKWVLLKTNMIIGINSKNVNRKQLKLFNQKFIAHMFSYVIKVQYNLPYKL